MRRISPSISTNTDPFQTIQTQTILESKKTKDRKNNLGVKDSIIEPWQAGSLNYEKQSSKIDDKKEKIKAKRIKIKQKVSKLK